MSGWSRVTWAAVDVKYSCGKCSGIKGTRIQPGPCSPNKKWGARKEMRRGAHPFATTETPPPWGHGRPGGGVGALRTPFGGPGAGASQKGTPPSHGEQPGGQLGQLLSGPMRPHSGLGRIGRTERGRGRHRGAGRNSSRDKTTGWTRGQEGDVGLPAQGLGRPRGPSGRPGEGSTWGGSSPTRISCHAHGLSLRDRRVDSCMSL